MKRFAVVLLLAACRGGGEPSPDDGGAITTDASPTIDPDAGQTQTQICTPGASTFCRCPAGQEGTQTCSADGLTLGPCEPCNSILPDGGV